MDTNISSRTRRPLYKRPWFWVAVIVVALIVGGAAYAIANKPFAFQTAISEDQGRVEIHTSPEKATVLLDGQERKGKTPMKFGTKVGKHTVTLRLAGYDDATIPIEVRHDEPSVIEQTFTKNGQITINQKTEDFKTYTNKKYKYRIKYPKNWEVKVDSDEVVNFYDKNRAEAGAFGIATALAHGEEQTALAILTQPNPGNLSPTEWYKARPEFTQEDQSQIKTKETAVNGKPAFQWTTPYGFLPYLNTVVTGNGNAYILQQIQNSPYRADYDKAIQTFELF